MTCFAACATISASHSQLSRNLKLGSWRRRISLPHHLPKLTLTGFGNAHGNASAPPAHECPQGGRFHCPPSSRDAGSPSPRPRAFVALPIFLFVASCVLGARGLCFPPSGFSFQGFSFLLRGQSSNVRWVCCCLEVSSVRRRSRADRKSTRL